MLAMIERLLVLGVHLKSEGYPNVLYRLQSLANSGTFDVSEINHPMWRTASRVRPGLRAKLGALCRAVWAHLVVVTRYLLHARSVRRVYLPYPAVFVLFALSYLPRRLLPEWIVADAFISLYDTIVVDRKLLAASSLLARALRWMEARSYRLANRIVVDTPQNAAHLCSMFDLPSAQVVAIPLSTNETEFTLTAPLQPKPVCTVLFVGTLIPLHGIAFILDAITRLAHRQDIVFRLVGDGQESAKIAALIETLGHRMVWINNWQSSAQLADEIANADICLGIFGEGNKTQRVCPFKLYAYAAIGRATITGDTQWLRESGAAEAFASVPVGNGLALAARIEMLADSPEARAALAIGCRAFYESKLGNDVALIQLIDCFRP